MPPPSPFAAYVRAHLPPLGLAPDREAEIVEELAQQMEQTFEAARDDGATPEAAERAAHQVVTDWDRLARELVAAERSRAERAARHMAAPLLGEPEGRVSGALLRDAWQDARFGLRWLGRHRGFTAAALATLALTIGASSSIFALVNAVLLAPLPFPAPQRLLVVSESAPAIGFPAIPFSPPDFLDYAAAQQSFTDLAVYRRTSVELVGPSESERIPVAKVSPSLFAVLGVQPVLGRAFVAEDAGDGADAAILSHRLWQRHFGGDPAVVGRTVLLDRRPHVVVGVMPPSAEFPLEGPAFNGAPAAVFVPLVFSDTEKAARGGFFSNSVVGRLRDGATMAGVTAEAAAIAARINAQYPPELKAMLKGASMELAFETLHEHAAGASRALVLALFAAVLLLLLAGCANVGSLLVSLTVSRQRELAVRASLGAGRFRLARQLLVECLVLSAAGGLLGLALASALLRLGPSLLPPSTPRVDLLAVDARVALFAVAISLLTAILFGVAPAWRWSRVAPAASLAAAGTRGATGASSVRLRRGLALAQCAFAVLLLVPAGLLGRTLWTLFTRPPGFDTTQAVGFTTYLPAGAYGEDGVRIAQFYAEAADRLGAVPGVGRAGVAMDRPLSPLEQRGLVVDGYDIGAGSPPIVSFSWVTPGYLEALGVPILAGRGLQPADRLDAPPVVLVSARAARQFWPDADPVGKRLRISAAGPWAVVAGVVGDVRDRGLARDAAPHLYAPIAQVPPAFLGENVVGLFRAPHFVAAATRPAAVAPLLAAAVRAIDPQLALTPPTVLGVAVRQTLGTQRLAAVVVGGFAVAALLIAAIGVHGIVAFGVAQRKRELGIRLALGATTGAVVRLVARDGVVLAAAGLAIGLAAAYGATRFIASLLVEVSPADPATFTGAAAMVLAVALVATWAPARAATHIDPSATIREE
ncbi:MAG: ADOP family duplicated permease [Vicinamibacterales bacterium]